MNKMETRQAQVLKEELQTMKDALMVEMKKMLKEELVVDIKKELAIKIKKEFAGEKENLLKIVKEIKKMNTDLDTSIQFMNSKFELVVKQNKELTEKVSKLVDENQVIKGQLKGMNKDNNSLTSQVDFLERNLKGKNVEICGVPFVKNENVVDLAVKVIKNVDSEFVQDDIDYARRLIKKDNNNVVTYGPVLVRFKSMSKRNYIYRKKKNLKDVKLNLVNDGHKKVFLNENLTTRNKKIFYHANIFRKQYQWKFIWTSNGMVFLRKNETSDAVIVRNLFDLDKLDC